MVCEVVGDGGEVCEIVGDGGALARHLRRRFAVFVVRSWPEMPEVVRSRVLRVVRRGEVKSDLPSATTSGITLPARVVATCEVAAR